MFIAILLFNIFHPGRMMPGKEADYPGGRTRRRMRKAGTPLQGRLADDEMGLKHGSGSGMPSPAMSEDGHGKFATGVPQFGTVRGFDEDGRGNYERV